MGEIRHPQRTAKGTAFLFRILRPEKEGRTFCALTGGIRHPQLSTICAIDIRWLRCPP